MRQHQLLYTEDSYVGYIDILKIQQQTREYVLSAAEMSPKTQKVSVPTSNGFLVKCLIRSEKEIKKEFVCVDPEYSTLYNLVIIFLMYCYFGLNRLKISR